jgi:hypothetical protein
VIGAGVLACIANRFVSDSVNLIANDWVHMACGSLDDELDIREASANTIVTSSTKGFFQVVSRRSRVA